MPRFGQPNRRASTPSVRFGLTVVLNAIVVAFLVLSQTPLAMAMTGGNSAPFLVEICGGPDGSYFITSEDEGEAPPEPCTHCVICYFPAKNSEGVIPDPITSSAVPVVQRAIHWPNEDPHMVGPEHYWSTCRGPPRVKMIAPMKQTLFLTAALQSGQASSGIWGTH